MDPTLSNESEIAEGAKLEGAKMSSKFNTMAPSMPARPTCIYARVLNGIYQNRSTSLVFVNVVV